MNALAKRLSWLVSGWIVAASSAHGGEQARPALTGRVLYPPKAAADGSIRFHVLPDSSATAETPNAMEGVAPLFDDAFDAGRKPAWQDTRGRTKVEGGKLLAADGRNDVVLAGVAERDVRATVGAAADLQMGILLRYRDPGNFVLAFYTPGAKVLGFHEAVEGNLGPWVQPVSTIRVTGKAIRMVAEVDDDRASVAVTDERGHTVRTRAMLGKVLTPGTVGLYHDTSVAGTQRFDNFRLERLQAAPPAGAVEVIVPRLAKRDDAVWAVGRRVRVAGREESAQTALGPRRALRVAAVDDIRAVADRPADRTLFPTRLPGRQWVRFLAEGFDQDAPACGVIYRASDTVTNGMPLGAIDTGCLDLETTGLLGYATIFNTHVPRRGPMNVPILGVSVGGRTWVLCDPQPKDGFGEYQPTATGEPRTRWQKGKWERTKNLVTPVPIDLPLEGVATAREIHYFGHYPVADVEFETDAPVSVGLRAWAPFLPGDVIDSMLPGAVFEVHVRNPTGAAQRGTVAFSFPGPLKEEAGAESLTRRTIEGGLCGVEVKAPLASYVLAVIGGDKARLGGELGSSGPAWAKIAEALPPAGPGHAGASAAVDFALEPGQTKVIRYVLAWHAPQWNAGGYNWAGAPHSFTHMYAKHYPSARQAAETLSRNHERLLRRVLAWQQVVYGDQKLPVWLRESLVNVLHLIAETGLWAQARPPVPAWVRPEDGLWGMNECPRGCPQIECIPCSFYGNAPLVYFFPQLALSTLRGYKGYQYPDGAAVWVFGGCTGQTPPIDFANPTRGYQFATNGISLAAMVDRYWLCYGDREKAFAREFFPTVKQNMAYTVNLRPAYPIGDRIIAMPTGNQGTEWFEAPEPGWRGMTAHVGGLHLAQLRIAQRLAKAAGDDAFAAQCDEWFKAGAASMDKLWTGRYWLNYWEPETNSKSDLIFGYQLDGQWITDQHGLPAALPADRVKITLETIKKSNIAVTKYGAVNYASPDGAVAKVAGYGPYSYFPPEALMLAMTYMYNGHREFGLELARKVWHNIVCHQGYTWDMPNIMRGDVDTGERTFGNDYYQDLMLWALPAAIEGKDFGAPAKPGGMAERMIRAAGRR